MTYRVSEAPEFLRPYLAHGVNINEDPEKAKGDCPLCGATNRFGVMTKTGQFNCFVCHQSGNHYTFFSLLHAQALASTSNGSYTTLARHRGLTIEGLKRFGIALNQLNSEWIAPGYNAAGKLNNLYRILPMGGPVPKGGSPKYQVLSSPGCKVGTFGHGLINAEAQNIYAVEGLWDGIALWQHTTNNPDSSPTTNPQPVSTDIGILACPGSGNFQPDWFAHCDNKHLHLCFDNDYPKLDDNGNPRMVKGQPIRPGWDGMHRIHSLILKQPAGKPRPSALSILNWAAYQDSEHDVKPCPQPGHHTDLPDGFDIRDLIRVDGSAAWQTLHTMFQPVLLDVPPKKTGEAAPKPGVVKVTPIPCHTFGELASYYAKTLHFTQDLQDTLAVMLAVVYSTTLPEEQLWFRIIGPPGSGKSTLAEAISAAREYVKPVSLMTGFHSGYTDYDSRGRRQANASPLLKLMNMCLIWKDADTLINSSSRDRIMAEARDLFDGTARSQYRNKVDDEFEGLRMSWMLCGTNSLRALNRTFLGERFLDCEIIGKTTDTSPFIKRAITNTYTSLAGALTPTADTDDDHIKPDRLLVLKQVTYGFIQHLKNTIPTIPTMLPHVDQMVEAHGNYLVYMRARIERDGVDLTHRPVLELPTRLAAQTVKLAFCLAIILGKPTIDEEVLRIVRKVVHNSAIGFQQEITKVIADAPNGISVMTIGLTLNLPETSVRRYLQDLQEFHIVQRKPRGNNSGQRGRDIHMWELTPTLRGLWDMVYPSEPTTHSTDTTKSANNHKPTTKKPQRRTALTTTPLKDDTNATPSNARQGTGRGSRNPKAIRSVPNTNHQANRAVHGNKRQVHKAQSRKAKPITPQRKGKK